MDIYKWKWMVLGALECTRLSTEDNPRSGRPSTATDYKSEVIVYDFCERIDEKYVRKLHMRPECLWLLFTESLLTI